MFRKEQFKELFYFTKSEQKGIITLTIILLILVIVNFSVKYFIEPEKQDFIKFKKEIAEFEASLKPKEQENYQNRLDKYITKRYDTLDLFEFNPNTTKPKQWKKLGLTNKQIGTITNYVSKGGKFYDKEDFRKIYGIRHKQFEILKPYIKIPKSKKYKKKDYKNIDKKNNYEKSFSEKNNKFQPDSLFFFNPNLINKKEWLILGFSEKQISVIQNYINKGGKFYQKEDLKKIYGIKTEQYEIVKEYIRIENNEKKTEKPVIENVEVDINALSENEFTELKGFWKYNAKRIIKYRNLLGGYYEKEQLLEIYGMKKKYYDKVKNTIIIDKTKIKKIRLNFVDVKKLAEHPYINWRNAEDIIKSRDEKGPFKNIEELRKRKIISKTKFNKLKYYVTIN